MTQRRRRCPPPATTVGTPSKAAKTQTRRARPNALHDSTTSGRKLQEHPQDPETAPNFLADLDTACTSAAVVANRLAATTRLLESHVRAGLRFGPEVARMTRMAMMAAQATELLHQVARDYNDWLAAA
jgi:hypothetical protein